MHEKYAPYNYRGKEYDEGQCPACGNNETVKCMIKLKKYKVKIEGYFCLNCGYKFE